MTLTVEKAFAEAQSILAQGGYKIFTPAWKHNHIKPAFIAVRPVSSKPSIPKIRPLVTKLSLYKVRIHHGKLVVGWLQPNCNDKTIDGEFKKKFGNLQKKSPRLIGSLRLKNKNRLHELVTPAEQEEFKILINDTQLS